MAERCGRLLIAECGCELSQGLSSWLAEQGHQCKAVDNIKGVLMTLQNEKIDVLVMDARLPEDKGYEAISIIKGMIITRSSLPIPAWEKSWGSPRMS
jgi:DNA-binding response OmpR family regulator